MLSESVPAGTPVVFADVVVSRATAPGYVATAPAGGTGAASNLEFGLDTSSSGTSIRLSADGRATISNKSSAPIGLEIRLQGYFTASTTEGAGLRTKTVRVFDTAMAASTTIGGTNGLPLRGIAGVTLNFNARGPTENGNFRSWPLGGIEPISTVAAWPTGKYRSGLAIVKPGTDGKIRVKNMSTGTVHLYLDMEGWFADPLPKIAPVRAPSAVLQAKPVGTALGMIAYAFVDMTGRLRTGHQTLPDDFGSIQWPTTSNSAMSGQPGISQLSNGKVQLSVQSEDSDVWATSQTAFSSPDYGAWSDLGGSMSSTPTQVTLSNGTTVVFAVDVDGKLWHYRPVINTYYWRNLGDEDLVGPITAVPVANGVQLVARDTTGAIKSTLYSNDGSILPWTSLGGAGITDRPAAAVYTGDKVRVFVRTADGTVQTKQQDINGNWPADWTTVGTFVTAGAPAAIFDPIQGRFAVVARGVDNEMYLIYETGLGSGVWNDWALLKSDVSDPSATDPTLVPFVNSSGPTWMIVFRNVNETTRVYERQIPSLARSAKAAPGRPTFARHTLPAPPD